MRNTHAQITREAGIQLGWKIEATEKAIDFLGRALDWAQTGTTGRSFETTLGILVSVTLVHAAIEIRDSFWFHILLFMAVPIGLASSVDIAIRIASRWRTL